MALNVAYCVLLLNYLGMLSILIGIQLEVFLKENYEHQCPIKINFCI